MKKSKFLPVLVASLALVAALLCGCGVTVDKVNGYISKSLPSVKVLTQSIVAEDKGVTVYSLDKTVTVSGDEANVTVDEATLGSDFSLQHNVSTSVSTKGEQLVLPVKLSDDVVESSVYENDTLVCVVTSDKAGELFGSDVSTDGDVRVVCNLSNNKLQQLTCTFTTATGKTVTLRVTCEY